MNGSPREPIEDVSQPVAGQIDGVAAASGAFDDGDVDDVVVVCSAGECTDCFGLLFGERLDRTQCEEPGEAGLA